MFGIIVPMEKTAEPLGRVPDKGRVYWRRSRELTKVSAFSAYPSGMTRFGRLQLVGPVTLFVAVLGSEIAARALAYAPSSELAWYIHLGLFGIFQKTHYVYDHIPAFALDYIPLVSPPLFLVSLAILLIACLGFVLRHRLLLAAASNFSFVCAAFLLFLWYTEERYSPEASLTIVGVPLGPNLYLAIALLGASLPSSLISHFLYFRDCRNSAA
jgi:hypothetical protein